MIIFFEKMISFKEKMMFLERFLTLFAKIAISLHHFSELKSFPPKIRFFERSLMLRFLRFWEKEPFLFLSFIVFSGVILGHVSPIFSGKISDTVWFYFNL